MISPRSILHAILITFAPALLVALLAGLLGPASAHAAPDQPVTVQTANVAHATATVDPVKLSPQCVRAARDILHASLSRHLRVEEDLSYVGMPTRVGQCNDQLAEAYYADGRQFVNGRHDHKALRTFLRSVIRANSLPTAVSGTGGKVRAEDGTYVPRSFYDQRPNVTANAIKPRCDFLGKRVVPDATYGHRCA